MGLNHHSVVLVDRAQKTWDAAHALGMDYALDVDSLQIRVVSHSPMHVLRQVSSASHMPTMVPRNEFERHLLTSNDGGASHFPPKTYHMLSYQDIERIMCPLMSCEGDVMHAPLAIVSEDRISLTDPLKGLLRPGV